MHIRLMPRRVEWVTLITFSLVDFTLTLHYAAREKEFKKWALKCRKAQRSKKIDL